MDKIDSNVEATHFNITKNNLHYSLHNKNIYKNNNPHDLNLKFMISFVIYKL